jgi:hypothetical protein
MYKQNRHSATKKGSIRTTQSKIAESQVAGVVQSRSIQNCDRVAEFRMKELDNGLFAVDSPFTDFPLVQDGVFDRFTRLISKRGLPFAYLLEIGRQYLHLDK